jgi:hypothetical protein
MKYKSHVLMSGLCAVTVAAIVFTVTRHRFFSDPNLWIATIALALAMAQSGQTTGAIFEVDGRASQIGTLGTRIMLSVLAVLLNVSGLFLAIGYMNTASTVLTILGIVVTLGAVVAPRALGKAIGEIDARVDRPSSHLAWADELKIAASRSTSTELRTSIERTAEELRFHPRDLTDSEDIDDSINHCVMRLTTKAENADSTEAMLELRLLESLLAERSIILRSKRRRA